MGIVYLLFRSISSIIKLLKLFAWNIMVLCIEFHYCFFIFKTDAYWVAFFSEIFHCWQKNILKTKHNHKKKTKITTKILICYLFISPTTQRILFAWTSPWSISVFRFRLALCKLLEGSVRERNRKEIQSTNNEPRLKVNYVFNVFKFSFPWSEFLQNVVIPNLIMISGAIHANENIIDAKKICKQYKESWGHHTLWKYE